MDSQSAMVLFEGKKIRKVWHKKEWWFSVVGIV
jgi:prophage antirepressor-like protein